MDSSNALAQLQAQQASAKDPNAILQAQNQAQGVNQAQDTVTGLRGAINNTTKLLSKVAPSVMGRTQNSLVTDAQSNRIIQNEQAPISATLTKQGQDYGYANEDLNSASSRANKAADLEYQDQQNKSSYLQNLYNTLYSREQDQAKVAREEDDRQEAIRQFNVSASSKSSGGSSSAASKASTQNNSAKIDAYLAPKRGKDGYVSPYDYNAAKSAWAQDGLSASQFDAIFGKYKNPKQPKGQYK